MSDRELVIGLVCEGQTDFPVVRALIDASTKLDVRYLPLQPQIDDTGRARPGSRTGWTAVREWCEQNREDLAEVLSPPVGDRLDALVIALDLDIAIEAGIESPPVKLKAYDGSRLCRKIKGWLQPAAARRQRLPSRVLIGIPCFAIETWVIAAVYPRTKRPERIADPASYLVTKGRLRTGRDGKPWKWLPAYEGAFASAVRARINHVLRSCSEANLLANKAVKLLT